MLFVLLRIVSMRRYGGDSNENTQYTFMLKKIETIFLFCLLLTLTSSIYLSRTHFHSPKGVRAIEVRLYEDIQTLCLSFCRCLKISYPKCRDIAWLIQFVHSSNPTDSVYNLTFSFIFTRLNSIRRMRSVKK